MYEFIYAVGIFAIGAVIYYLVRNFERSKPARKLSDNPRRYYNKLEYILSDFRNDETVNAFLMEVAEDLEESYVSYPLYLDDEHLNSIFGSESFEKNREEALAICYLLSYRKSPIINNMRDKLEKRFWELKVDPDVCPPALYEPFKDVNELIRRAEFEKSEKALKASLIEELSKSIEFREMFSDYSVEQMLSLFSKYRYDIGIYSHEDVSKESVRQALNFINKEVNRPRDE